MVSLQESCTQPSSNLLHINAEILSENVRSNSVVSVCLVYNINPFYNQKCGCKLREELSSIN
jgi:hypothetical protein